MGSKHPDIVIAGGGPVGAALALGLRASGLSVTLIEARAPGAAVDDTRTIALSRGSRLILERLGVWPALAAALLGLLAAPASAAAVQTDYEAGLDLSPYATYAWKTDSIVAPGDAEVQAWIVAAVERELGARGLRRVDASPDLWVVTYDLARQMDGAKEVKCSEFAAAIVDCM